ncbi:glycosyltransferase family 2 protein [Sulfitobacter sp. HNIBRBA3233]|uniref:glycosyltransferase family 2 protein n=1 Tax=Sulfitobacter marinivivus TaxID=3158558 RepID=UPI0032E013CC
MSNRPSLLTRLRRRISERKRRRRFARALEHVHGDPSDVGSGDVLAIVLVRNGMYHLDAFFDYYRRLGIKSFAFVDNGSTDGTCARIAREPGTVIDRVALPLAQFEDLMRAYPAQTYGADRWCLYVDMDEQFDFEGRDRIGLSGLIGYLEGRGDTALMAQMLEMFPDAPLSETAHLDFAQSLERFRFYDTTTIDRFDYHSPDIPFEALLRDNTVPSASLQFYFGGVRGRVFAEACCLTKHPLIFNGPQVRPAPHPHLSQGVKLADFSAVIRHYKFAGNSAARDRAQAAGLAHGEDRARLAVLEETPDVSLYADSAARWTGIDALYEGGFLVRSDSFTRHIAQVSQ